MAGRFIVLIWRALRNERLFQNQLILDYSLWVESGLLLLGREEGNKKRRESERWAGMGGR